MSDKRDATKKSGGPAGKSGDLARDVIRLADAAGVDVADVYAFLCTGYTGSGGGPGEWMDKDVSDDVRKYLPVLKT